MVDVAASFASSLSPVVTATTGRDRLTSAAFITSLSGVAGLDVARQRLVSADFITSLNASLVLGDTLISDRSATAAFTTSLKATASLSGASDRRGRTLNDLVEESLSLWGFLCPKNAPRYAITRAVTDINTALQLVWNNVEGRDYWSNETLTLTLDDEESSIDLPDTVQNVVGPCRRADNNRPLTPVRSIGELESFSALYLDGATLDEPVAYHVERLKQSADDPARCVLHVTPAVAGASVSLLLEVVKEPPRYTADDLNSSPLVPIPHQYAETLLIPIIRYNASSYYLFTGAELKGTIDREYQMAMVSLGLADPNPAKEGGGA
jgi:hypothetical protein